LSNTKIHSEGVESMGKVDLFKRFNAWKIVFLSNPALARLERFSSPHTHPGLSAWRILLQKARVVILFIIRRVAQGVGRKAALRELRQRRNSASGKVVLVVGNGPSADELNPDEIARWQKNGRLVVVATNYFLGTPLGKNITPDYLVWADDVFDPLHEGSAKQWELAQAREKTCLVVPWTWKTGLSDDMHSRVLFFDNDSLESITRNISPLKPRGYHGSTGVKALAFAIHLGGDQTLLSGVDLSNFKNFSVDQSNEIWRGPAHVKGADSGTMRISEFALLGISDALYSAASELRYLRTHFADRDVVNLGSTSLIDAFPRDYTHPLTRAFKAKP